MRKQYRSSSLNREADNSEFSRMSDENSKMDNKIPDILRDFIMAIYKETFLQDIIF